jgi:DNA-binding PadR family transcriptional regulator
MKPTQSWPTKTEMTVLSLLMNAPQGLYGLEVVEQSNKEVKRGSVYVLLGRLEEKGYVERTTPKVDASYPGLPRPIYKITAPGRKVLALSDQLEMKEVFA